MTSVLLALWCRTCLLRYFIFYFSFSPNLCVENFLFYFVSFLTLCQYYHVSVWYFPSCLGMFSFALTFTLKCKHGFVLLSFVVVLSVFRESIYWSLQWRRNGHDGVSNHQAYDCLLNRLFRRRSKKTSKPRVTGLCAGNSPVTGEFPAQRASNAENVFIWWRHHVFFWAVSLILGQSYDCVSTIEFTPEGLWVKSICTRQ